MESLGVIMLTNSSDEKDRFITRRSLLTLKDSTIGTMNVALVESGNDNKNFYSDLVNHYIVPNEKFNYNKFLNLGFNLVNQEDWLLITNDDVSYHKNWFQEIMSIHGDRPDITSFSPSDPLFQMKFYPRLFVGTKDNYLESYKVSESVCGWSILIKMESAKIVFPLDEQFDMYYQDNDYAEVLKINNIRHALSRHSIASHLNTFDVLKTSESKIAKMKIDENKFRNKWKIYT
jgi:hypothetical protein